MPRYTLNGKSYNIPDSLAGKFESQNPSATIAYSANGKNYNIPVNKRDAFLKAFPDATMGEEKAKQAKPAEQPVQKPQQVEQEVQAKPQQVQQAAPTKQQPYQPTWQEQMAIGMSVSPAQSVAQNAISTGEKLENETKQTSPFGSGTVKVGENSRVRKGKQSFNAETGQFEDTYLTTDGKSYKNPIEASMVQDNLDELGRYESFKENMKAYGIDDIIGDNRKDPAELLKEAEAERDKIRRIMDNDKEGEKELNDLIMSGGYDPTPNARLEEREAYQVALRMLDRRIDAIKTAKDNGGFWKGTGDVLTDPSSYSFGLTDLQDSKQMSRIKEKLDNGDLLTSGEQTLARNYLMNEAAQSLNKDNDWHELGQSFGQTLSFMKDFAVTGGGFLSLAKGGMALGGKAGTKLATKALGDYMTKSLGTKLLGKAITTTGKGAGLIAGSELGGAALNNTIQLASSMADINNKRIGELTVGKDGNLTFENSQSLAKSVLQSQTQRIGENASELVGVAFDAVPGILGKVIQRTPVGKALNKMVENKFWKGFEKGLNYLGVQSVWGEGMEEEYGMARTEILNKITDGQFDPNAVSITDLDNQLKTWKTVGITSMLLRVPAMVVTGVDGANYYGNKYNLNQSDIRMRNVFNDNYRYSAVKDLLDGATNANIDGVLSSLMNNAQLSEDEKKAAFLYANDLVSLRGFNIGNVVAAANGYKAPPKVDGYNIRGLHVDEVDKDGNVLNSYDFENADALKAGLYEIQQQRADDTLRSDVSVMKARPDDPFTALYVNYCDENGYDTDQFYDALEKPSMERTEAEQQMIAPFAEILHNAVYDNTMLHEEQSVKDGEDTADTDSIDMESSGDEGKAINEQWLMAQGKRHMAFVGNEDLKQEVESMEASGLSHQEIISALETFNPDEVQTLVEYYNAKAKYEGYVNRMADKINEEAANSRMRHTFKGTINGNADTNNLYTITDGVNEYFLVSGNVTTDSSTGQITGSDSGLIIGMDLDGSFVNIGDTSGYSVMPSTMSLDQFEEEERTRLQEAWTEKVGAQPQEPAPETMNTGTQSIEPVPETEEEGTQQPAIERIPKDEQGTLLYEKAAPEDTYDALVEQVGEQSAPVIAKKQLDSAQKRHDKLVKDLNEGKIPGNTLQEQIEGTKKMQQQIAEEEERIKYWNSVLAVPNNRRLNEAAAQSATTPAAGTQTPSTPTGGETNVPDWSMDKASDARARGYRMTNGHRVDRQEPIANKVEGNEVEVKFDKTEEPTNGKLTVVDAGSLAPSHVNGQRNINFFIDEAQPKDRTDVDSEASSNRIAEKVNPEEITGGVTAYTGSPVVNSRGEVIQGNNRTIGLQKMWGNAAYEESQKKYKQYLIDHAAEFGLDPSEIEKMQNPVLVRMVDVDDNEAIRLGQKTAANTESGGIERIDPMRTIQTMGDNIRIFMNLLFGNATEEQTLLSMIADNGVDVLKWLNDGRNHPKYITDTQYQSCFDRKGNLTEEAKTDLRKIVEGLLFTDAPDRLPQMFYSMPAKAQNAILATFWRDAQSPEGAKILKDIQESIEAFAVINGASEEFRNAKDVNAARTAVKDLQKQTQMFGNTATALEKFSNFALELAIKYKGDKQNNIRDCFNAYYDSVQGKGGNLFQAATTKTKEEAIKEIFGIETNNNTEENGDQGSNLVGLNGETGEAGTRRSEGESGVGKPVEGGEQPATSGTRGNGGAVSEREQYIADHPLTVEEINSSNASEAQKILARQYLDLNNPYVSEMAKAAYTFIYNKKVATQNKSQQAETKPETPSTPAKEAPRREEQPTQPEAPAEGQPSAQEAAKAKMAAALAKLKKHSKKDDVQQDISEKNGANGLVGTVQEKLQTVKSWFEDIIKKSGEKIKTKKSYVITTSEELDALMAEYPDYMETLRDEVGPMLTDGKTVGAYITGADIIIYFPLNAARLNKTKNQLRGTFYHENVHPILDAMTKEEVADIANEIRKELPFLGELVEQYYASETEHRRNKEVICRLFNYLLEQYGEDAVLDGEFRLNEINTENVNNIVNELKYGTEKQKADSGMESGGNGSLVQRDTSSSSSIKRRKGGEQNAGLDLYSIENLTPEQINDMFEVVEAGAELGYTLLDGVQSKEEWINQMRDAIAEPLKDATGYNDQEVDELLNDMWNYPYAVDGQTKTVGEWAADKGINVNENNNEQGETNGDNVPQSEELPAGSNVAGSSETGTVTSGNNEANPESGGETGFGPLFGGVNSGTGEVGETTPGTTSAEVEGTPEGNGEAGAEGKPTVRTNVQGTTVGTQGNTKGESGTSSSGQPSTAGGTVGKQSGATGRTGQSGNQGSGVRGTANVNGGTGNGGGETTGTGDIGSPSMGQPERVTEKKPLADITQEKAPYKPSSIGGKFAIGSVVPSGIADAIAKAFERLKKKFKKSTLDFVREELGYKSNEEMLSDFDSGKTNGLASEQVDAVALAIGKMKDGKSFIVGDMTGVGKGRTAAALIRWGIQHGKKVVFITEKSGLFSDMYRDLTDIGCDYMPFVTNDDTDANITDADGNKVIPKPNSKMQAALWQSDKDELPTDKKGRKYDFVMTTYSQASNPRGVNGKRKLDWLKEYAKDAIVIMDESHNASGESNRGQYFQEIVQGASGVTFLSATYAKRPDNMLLYAIKSSMSELNMAVGDMLQAIKEYGVAMQELMASALFGSGEMIRRERDMSDVKTTWTDPKEIYSEEDYEQCRKTSDKTMAVINDIIDFQRTYIDPIVKAHEKEHEQGNTLAALTGGPQVHTSNTAYKSQVSNVVNLMTYAMKAKKAAEMAIEQIKQGKKPVIAVENTLDSYIKELPDEMDSADFGPVLEKGIAFSLRYMTATYEKGDGGYKKVKGSEVYFNAEDELDDDGLRALENLRQRVNDYLGDSEKVDLTLSPIDLIKQMIADAGYSCGEITGRGTQLVRKEGGGYKKESIKQDKKGAARKFNGGSKSKPLPENEQYQALVLNVAGATGISLHSSKTFGNQQPRTMIILQPARDVNTEVQMRGRIDRTGQVHRGEYFYLTSPIPAEQKITMMLKQKLASLDAQSVGTKEVSSNKVDSQDMDNKYGDQVCFDFLMEHLMDVNAFLENGIYQDKKTREWTYDPGLLYDVLKDLQRMPCDMQEMVISELTQRYADQIEYLNQNGINDLETTAMNLEAVTIDKATFVKGKDNESENEFAHDTAIERVEVNVLKKPMRSSDIKKKMKDLDALDEDGLPKEGVLGQTTDKVKTVIDNLYADREAKFAEKEKKHEEKLRLDHPKKDDQTDEEYEAMIQNWPSLVEMKNKDKADLLTYGANLQEQYNNIYKAAMYLKPGRPYLVPLTDEISGDAPMMYGRFLGFQMKNGDPRQVQAVFAVKDSRAMITVPVVNKFKVIEKIINERNDMEIVALQRNPDTYEDYTIEERAKVWDEWWDKMIPKNTNRQIRFMITGNVVQACGSLGKYKGQIVTFTRKNKETGEITLERGMLLAENFDPENFKVRKAVEKKDVWDSYGEVKDDRSGISCHREGSRMVVKFEKRSGEKLVDHPAQKDETLKSLAMNGEIRPSGKKAILCVINEENVEKALEHLYKEYGYTKEELFVMPDSTEKPDAIVRTNKPYQDIIDQYQEKYGYNQYSVENKIKQMLKRYKMDVNNDNLKEQIREAVQLRQAYLRRDYARQSSERLAWEVLVRDQYIEQAGDSKEERERNMRIKEAILEELEYRGFKGKAYHYTQGKMTTDDVKKMFNEMNDITTPEGQAKKALFDKVMAKVEKLPMEIFMNEKISNDTGGFAGGRVVNYNWKYMNADYISDQAKADTILHELIHTVTAYADRCMEDGLDHLLDQDMRDAVNELHSIFETIKNDPTFVHDGVPAYGVRNVREMLSEAGSNSEFREDLKKTNLWMKLWSGILKFFGIKQNVQGARQVNAFDLIMERLDYLIDNFNQEAWDKYYQGTSYGGYGYRKMDMARFNPSEEYEVGKYKSGPIERFSGSTRAEVKQNGKRVAWINKTKDGYQAETPTWSYATDFYPTEQEALDALKNEEEENIQNVIANSNGTIKAEVVSRYIYDLPKKHGLRGGAKTYTISSKDDLENLRGLISNRALRTVEKLYNEGNTGAAYLPESDIVVVFGERLSDSKEGESAWWHEQTHGFWNTLSEDAKDRYGKVFLDYLKKNRPAMYNFIVNNYEKFDLGEEACAYFIGGTIEKYGTETFLNANFEGIEEICNFANELRDYIRNGREEENGNQVRRERTDANGGAEVSGRGGLQGRNDQQEEGDEEVKRMITNPMDAIDRAAKSWRDERSSRMPGSPSSPGTISEKQVYENRINTAGYVTTEAYQDSMLGLKVGQNAIAHDEDIPDSQNAYQAENLAHGKTKNEQDLYKAFYQDPLVDTISMILNKTGMNWGDIDRYVFSKHGLERNRQLFVRDTLNKMEKRAKTDADKQAVKDLWNKWNACKAENYDKLQNGDITLAEYFANLTTFIKRNINSSYNPEEHDYSGFREMFGDDTGKYSEADILGEIKDAEDKMEPDLMNKLWEQINAANKYALDRYREAGMKTDEQMDEIEQMFYWYVPMRGFKDDTGEDVYQYMTSKDFRVGSTGSLLKHAKGRGSEAAFPIATMFSMANRAISDCNQNIVKQHLWRLCLAHPDNDLIVLKSCWVEKNSDDEWEVSYPPIDEKMTEAQIKDVMKTYYEDLRQKEARGEAKVIRNKEHFDYRPSSKEKKHQHIVEVMVNGEKKLMIVVGNPRLAQAINGLTRFKVGDNPIRKWNAAAKNWMSTMATTYNATFMVRNMARDWTHFTAILTTREGKGYATYANKYYWKALPKMKSLFKKYREGTLDMSNQMERDFKDFMDNGGTTGYVFMNKAEDIQKDMAKLLKKMKRGGAIKLTDSMFEKILDYVEACNEAVENCARFATYMASRNYAGRTRKRSAYDAKEVTVNFNKKGAGSKTAGFKSKNKNVERIASIAGNTAQFVGEGKMFFNATIQAIATIFKNFQNKDGSPNLPYIARFATIYAAVPFAGSIAMAAINKTLIEAAGGDDDDDPYANLPEWVRRKNICIYMGWVPGVEKIFGGDGEFGKKFFHNSFLTIPIGQEMAAFYSLGDMVAGLTINENMKPVDANVVSECVNFLNVFSPVDFESKVTNKDGLGAMPSEIVSRFSTVLAPIVAVGENVAWTGKPIFREDRFGDDERRPEYQMVYNSTNQGYVIFSKALNDISGGDDVKRGWAQVNPGTMQYIVEQYTGGPGKFISNTSSTVRDIYEAVRPDGDAQFNVRKLEMVKAFLQQSDERTQFQRTQAKYWKYKNEAKDFDYELKGYQEKAAESPYHYLQLQKHLKGPDLLRSQIIKETDKYLKDLNKLAVEGKTANDRRAARQLYNQVLKGIVDQLDKAENVAPPVED